MKREAFQEKGFQLRRKRGYKSIQWYLVQLSSQLTKKLQFHFTNDKSKCIRKRNDLTQLRGRKGEGGVETAERPLQK